MPYSRLSTDFRDLSNQPFNGEMVAVLHQAITLPEGTKIQQQRFTYPVKNGVAYDDRTYTLLAELPATATATPANVLVTIWLKHPKSSRLTYVGAYIIPEENPPGAPVPIANLQNQDPEAGIVLSVVSLGGLSGVINLAGQVTVDAASNSITFHGLQFRGTWDMSTAYGPGDVVSHELDLWVAITTNTASEPIEGADWSMFLRQPEVPIPEAAGINWRGQWGVGTTYAVDDAVEYRGASWIALVNHTSVPGTPPAIGGGQWDLIAAAGVGVTWKGPWDNAINYQKGDGVSHNGRAYIANQAVSAGDAPGTEGGALAAGNVATAGGGHLVNVGATLNHEVGKAFDGDDATYWEADSDSGYYNTKGIGNVWGTMRTVEKLVIRQHPTDYHTKVPSLFFEITTNGVDWVALAGGAHTIPGNGFGTQEMLLAEPVACTGFRVKPGSGTTAGGAGYPWRIYNLELHAQATGGGAFWDLISDKGVVWLGTWSNVTTYKPDDLVSYNGEAWLCIQSHTNQVPAENAYWTKFAGSGAAGVTTLDGLMDVDLTTAPTDGQVLKFDGVSSTWKAGADNEGAGSPSNTAMLSRVYANATTAVANTAATTKIAFGVVDYDSGGTVWSTANNEWTVPAAGDYEVVCGLQGIRDTSGSNQWNICVNVDGVERARMTQYASANQNWASGGHAVIPLPNLAVSAKIDIRVGTANNLTVQAGQYVTWAVLKRVK